MKAQAGWRWRWGWAQSGWALFIGAGTLFANGTPFGNGPPAGALTALAYNVLQFGVPLVLALQLANAAVDARRWPPLWAYGMATLSANMLGVWVIAPALWPVLGKAPWWTSLNDWVLAATSLGWQALGVAVYAQRRFSLRAQARLQAAQRTQQAHQQALAATRLLALQARVEPLLLFERLQRIDGELRDRPERARDRLAALIALLRAQQPHLDAARSTLGRELEAVDAYARLQSQDGRHTERLHIAPLEPLAERPLAPLVLLPLVRPLLALPGLWQLTRTPSAPGQLALRVQALGPDPDTAFHAAGQVPLEVLNERLHAVHGPGAALVLDRASPLPAFVLQWPDEGPPASTSAPAVPAAP